MCDDGKYIKLQRSKKKCISPFCSNQQIYGRFFCRCWNERQAHQKRKTYCISQTRSKEKEQRWWCGGSSRPTAPHLFPKCVTTPETFIKFSAILRLFCLDLVGTYSFAHKFVSAVPEQRADDPFHSSFNKLKCPLNPHGLNSNYARFVFSFLQQYSCDSTTRIRFHRIHKWIVSEILIILIYERGPSRKLKPHSGRQNPNCSLFHKHQPAIRS